MKIKNIYIKSFGKLKDLNLEFQEGLNIIYGSNESGKSTIQNFIKVMFYGMNSLKRSIADNERKKFIPWDESRAAGRLTFEDENGNDYVIDRSFGDTKKEDHTEVYNFITGQSAVHLDNYQPGKDLFGLGEDAFEKTLFIKQLGAKVAMDKEDEIMKKLTNIQESGQEDLSYNKAKTALENYKKSLKGRKKGKIDLLEDQIMNLKEEQQELEGLHRDNLEDSKLLQEKLNKIKEMEHNLEQALKNKVEIKNRGLSSEEEKNFNEKFYSGDIKEAEDLLYKATEAFVLYKERNEALLTMEEEGKNLQEQLKKERRELQHYEGLQGLEEDIEKKLNSIAMEKRELEGLLQQESVLEGEIKALEGRVVYLNSEFQEVVRVLNISTEEENTILKLEEKLQNLSHTIDAAKLKDSNELKKDILKDKRNNFKFLMLAAFIMSLAIIYGLISKSLPATIIGLIGILTGIYSYSQYKKASAELKSLTKEDRSRVELLLKEKTEVEEKLNELYEKYQVESYMEVKAKLDSCRSTISTLEGIKNNIKEKEKQLESLRAIKAEEGLAKIQGYYDKIFKQCKSSDLDSFYQGLKAYKDLQLDLMRLEEQVRTKRLEIEKRAKGLRSAQEELDQLLSSFKPFDISKDKKMAYYENFIESIKEGLEKIRQGEKEESKKLNELVDSLDEEIAKLNKKISESKEVKKDIEHKIETRFNNKRELWLVEEELGQCRARIEKLKTLFEASDLASSVLEEAFQEVQSNFIPRLNKEVGHILNGLTEGKYNMVTVSPMNNYEIKVLQEESLRSIDFLSGGTFDQVYFSLRLALCNLIFKEKTLPLFFDDAFIQYDESRLYRAMKFLQDYSKEHQVVVFTCRKLPLKETINLDLLQ